MKNKGFMLIGMIIVLAAIGILTLKSINRFIDETSESSLTPNTVKIKLELYNIDTASNMHFSQTGRWPVFGTGDRNNESLLKNIATLEGWQGPYTRQWPENYSLEYRKFNGRKLLLIEVSNKNLPLKEKLDKDIDAGDGSQDGKIIWSKDWFAWVIAENPEITDVNDFQVSPK